MSSTIFLSYKKNKQEENKQEETKQEENRQEPLQLDLRTFTARKLKDFISQKFPKCNVEDHENFILKYSIPITITPQLMEKKLTDLGISGQDQFSVFNTPIILYTQDGAEKNFKADFEKTTVRELERTIKEKFCLNLENFRICYRISVMASPQLMDKTLNDIGIRDQGKFHIFDMPRLFISFPDGPQHSLKIDLEINTFQQLNEMIDEKYGYDPYTYALNLNGVSLKPELLNKYLSDKGIGDKYHFQVVVKKLKLMVRYPNGSGELLDDVDPRWTVKQLKDKIKDKFGFDMTLYRLNYAAYSLKDDNDTNKKKLGKDLKIGDNDEIQIVSLETSGY